jgi:hypothetical protein
MKYALTLSAVLIGGIGGMAVTTSGPAHAVVYCQYIDYPSNCIVRPGVRLIARPAVRATTVGVGAPGVGVRAGTPTNRGGPVDRAGRR